MMRMVIYTFHGNLTAAFKAHPVGPIVALMMLFWSFDVLPIQNLKWRKVVNATQTIIVVALLVVWVIRMIGLA